MIHNPQENGVIMTVISRVRPETPPSRISSRSQKGECKSLQEFYRRADKIIHLENAREAIQARKSTPSKKNNDNSKKWKNEDRRTSPDKINKEAKAPDLRVLRPPPKKITNYTDLVYSWKDVFLAAKQSGVFKQPDPLHGDHSKRNQNKFCRFHRDIGHTT